MPGTGSDDAVARCEGELSNAPRCAESDAGYCDSTLATTKQVLTGGEARGRRELSGCLSIPSTCSPAPLYTSDTLRVAPQRSSRARAVGQGAQRASVGIVHNTVQVGASDRNPISYLITDARSERIGGGDRMCAGQYTMLPVSRPFERTIT